MLNVGWTIECNIWLTKNDCKCVGHATSTGGNDDQNENGKTNSLELQRRLVENESPVTITTTTTMAVVVVVVAKLQIYLCLSLSLSLTFSDCV